MQYLSLVEEFIAHITPTPIVGDTIFAALNSKITIAETDRITLTHHKQIKDEWHVMSTMNAIPFTKHFWFHIAQAIVIYENSNETNRSELETNVSILIQQLPHLEFLQIEPEHERPKPQKPRKPQTQATIRTKSTVAKTIQLSDACIENTDQDILDFILAKAVFGLKAQGHIPTIQQMLSENKTWDEIGTKIGWLPETAREHYTQILENEKATETTKTEQT